MRLLAEPGAPVRRRLPLRPIAKTYADRLLVVGWAERPSWGPTVELVLADAVDHWPVRTGGGSA